MTDIPYMASSIYSHELVKTHVIEGQRSVRIAPPPGLLLPPCLLITAVQQLGPSSWLIHSSEQGVIWMCRAYFTNSSCLLPWSCTVVSSQWIGWWFSHACSITADFIIISSPRYPGVPSVSSPFSVDLTTAAGDRIYHIGLFTR